ncbi:MAG: glutathione peroxidase [Cyclobacteriaceae bacterium]|nr:glutathione peroxidase [Cyclobacteriaceae bacterium]
MKTTQSIYDFSIKALNSEELIDLSKYKGKKLLIVNVASKCGFTPQYADLQALYEKYNDKLEIIGCPSNQFLMQEPGTELAIANFCTTNYGVTFPLTTKVRVKGMNKHPLYEWLTKKKLNGKANYSISWNFNKFLISEDGNIIEYYGSRVNPLDEKITVHLDN